MHHSQKACPAGVAAPPLVCRWTCISSFCSEAGDVCVFYFSAAIYMCNVLHRDMLNARPRCPFCQLCLLKRSKVKRRSWFRSGFVAVGVGMLLFGQQDATRAAISVYLPLNKRRTFCFHVFLKVPYPAIVLFSIV